MSVVQEVSVVFCEPILAKLFSFIQRGEMSLADLRRKGGERFARNIELFDLKHQLALTTSYIGVLNAPLFTIEQRAKGRAVRINENVEVVHIWMDFVELKIRIDGEAKKNGG